MKSKEAYHLTLVPVPDSVPGIIRLRRFLKLALRGFGLRCVSVEPVSEASGQPDQANSTGTAGAAGIDVGEDGQTLRG